MNAQEITLNIAVNLGRLARWVDEGKINRVGPFLLETDTYLKQLDTIEKSQRFLPTYLAFQKKFQNLKTNNRFDKEWAEEALTWANILTHRAKLT